MLRFLMFHIILFPYVLTAQPPFVEEHNVAFKNARYDVFIKRVDSTFFDNISIVTNSKKLSEAAYFESLSKSLKFPFFAITSSMVGPDCSLLGLYILNGKKINDLNTNQGNGNFYLKPNGVIFADSPDVVKIEDAEVFREFQTIKMAIQSGPMLLVNGNINPAFDKNSKNKNFRCGVGSFSDKNETFLVFIRSNTEVTFFEFSQVFLEKYNCVNALNLESSSNCSMHLPTAKMSYSPKVHVCRYLMIKL